MSIQEYKAGKVVAAFGEFTITIFLPAIPPNEQLEILRQKVIIHTNNFVEMGAWNEPLSEEEIEEFLINVKIQPTES